MAQLATNWNEAVAGAVERAAASVAHIDNGCGGASSGVVWDEHLVVTSSRALGRDEDIVLRIGDDDVRNAELVGRDPATDIALLRVDGDPLAALDFRDAAELKVGHSTLALGRPGRVIRASLRIVGALADDVRTPGGGRLERYIETDRRLPPGFSGGPLIDLEGKAIGLNTRGVFRGADLAIPHATLQRVVDELLTHGHVRRGFIGVGVHRVRLPRVIRDQLKRRSGALVVSVREDSPAETAGLVLGDVIVELDGEAVTNPDDLRAALHGRGAGTVNGRVLRAGSLETFSVDITDQS